MKSIMTFNGNVVAIDHEGKEESLWKQVAEIVYNESACVLDKLIVMKF